MQRDIHQALQVALAPGLHRRHTVHRFLLQFPFRISLIRPGRSVTKIDPSGKNAADQGCSRSFVITTRRSWRSSADSYLIEPSGISGVSHTIGGGATDALSS
jgi:hypothetical protein